MKNILPSPLIPIVLIMSVLHPACGEDDADGGAGGGAIDPTGRCGSALCQALPAGCGLTTDACGEIVDCGACRYDGQTLSGSEGLGAYHVDIAWEPAGPTIAAMRWSGRVEAHVERAGVWTREVVYESEDSYSPSAEDAKLSLSLGASSRAVAWTDDGDALVARSAGVGDAWEVSTLSLPDRGEAIGISLAHGSDDSLYAVVSVGGFGDAHSVQLYRLASGATDWEVTEVTSAPVPDAGRRVFGSTAVATSRGVTVAFYRLTGEDAGVYVAEGEPGAAFTVSPVDTGLSTPAEGGYLSLAEGPSGERVVTYGREPRELVRATSVGGGWSLEVLSSQHGDRANSLAVASDGTVHVAHFYSAGLRLSSGRGDTFVSQVLSGECDEGSVALALDDDDGIHLAFACEEVRYLRRAGRYPDDIGAVCANIIETVCARASACRTSGQGDDFCWTRTAGGSTCANSFGCASSVEADLCGNPTVSASARYACEAALEGGVCVDLDDGEGAVLLPPACGRLRELGGALVDGPTERARPVRDCAGSPDADGDGYDSTLCGGMDCNDEDPAVAPFATELCDGIDNDCTGFFEADGEDQDRDRFVSLDCGGMDCNDNSREDYPGATEVCDARDNDCDGEAELDADGDGAVAPGVMCVLEDPSRLDCDDGDALRNPRLDEICDGVDNDCDGEVDEGDHLDGDCETGLVCIVGTGCEESPFEHLEVGGLYVCAARANGALVCWGTLPSRTSDRDPYQLAMLESGVASLSLGPVVGCLVDGAQTVSCFGVNSRGQLGTSDGSPYSPNPVEGLGAMMGVAVGATHACAWDAAGAVYCWGGNDLAQAGMDGGADLAAATAVPGLSGITQVAAGRAHTCALRGSDGAVLCWGANDGGQRGDPGVSPDPSATPQLVDGLPAVVEIAASDDGMLARTASGAVWDWGRLERFDTPRGPTERTDVSGAAGLTAGAEHACALLNSGAFSCWGDDSSKQLGMRSGEGTASALEVGLAIAAGAETTCALATRTVDQLSGAWCWGNVWDGQGGEEASSVATRTATPLLAAEE